MKSNVDLLNQYKEEKALVIGSEEERTGLEDFPTFKEWKAEYVKEYNETHVTVDVEDADAHFDQIVDEADEELEALAAELSDDDVPPEEEDEDMTEATPAAPTAEKPAAPKKRAPARKKAAAKKKAPAKRAAAKKAPLKKKAVGKKRASSKTAKAQKIFDRFYGKKTRAEIIEKFVAQCDLTANGAATYYQKMKKAAS